MANSKAFDDLASQVLYDFVRSVLIIDDQWFDGGPDSFPLDDDDESALVVEPAEDEDEVYLDEAVPEPPVAAIPRPAKYDTDLLAIRDAVQGQGILFSGFRYESPEQFDQALRLAQKADILILDWELLHDDGAEACKLIKELVARGALRFICIFTAHDNPDAVRLAILQLVSPDIEPDPASQIDFRIGSVILAIRNKPSFNSSYSVPPERLLEVAIEGLSSNFRSLIQLGVLEMTSLHRDQLTYVLARFDSSADLAYYLESLSKTDPIGAGDPFLGLLVDEWRARLEIASPKVLGSEGLAAFGQLIQAQIDSLPADGFSASLRAAGVPEDKIKKFEEWPIGQRNIQMQEWVQNGLADANPVPPNSGIKKSSHIRLALVNALDPKVNKDLAQGVFGPALRLDALYHQQRSLPAYLNQGTILRHASDRYLICTTPLCDAARPDLKCNNVFYFVEASAVANSEIGKLRPNQQYCVVEIQDQPVCLRIDLRPIVALRVLKPVFQRNADGTIEPISGTAWVGRLSESPNNDQGITAEVPQSIAAGEPSDSPTDLRLENGTVASSSQSESQVATGSPGTFLLYPVAQLRVDHALALTSQVATLLSRVGVDRVETLRSVLGPEG